MAEPRRTGKTTGPNNNHQPDGQPTPSLADVLDALRQRGHEPETSAGIPNVWWVSCPNHPARMIRINNWGGKSVDTLALVCMDANGKPTKGCDPDSVIDALNIRSLFPKHESDSRQLRVTRASDMKMRATRWIWEEENAKWMPLGGLALLGGREGIGKSTWAYRIAALLTQGKLPGCYYGTPKGVIVSASEDSWEATIVPRLVAVGADLEKVYRVDVVTAEGHEMTLTLPEDNHALRELVGEVDAGLILLDPLLSVVSGKLDTYKDQQVRQALGPLSILADETKVSILGLIHVNKGVGNDLLTSLMGSRAFAAVARAVLFAARDQEDDDQPGRTPRFLFGQPKNNLAAVVPHTVRYHIEGVHVGFDAELLEEIWSSQIVPDGLFDLNISDVIAGQEKAKPNMNTAIGRAKAWLKEFLTLNGSTDVQVIFDAGQEAGHKERTLQRARDEIGAKAGKGSFGEKGQWWLPDLVTESKSTQGLEVGGIGVTGANGGIGATGAVGQNGTSILPVAPTMPMPPMPPDSLEVGAVGFPIFKRLQGEALQANGGGHDE